MMVATKNKVTFSRKTWEELRADDFYREVVEAVEDREALLKAKTKTEYFVDLEEYHKQRMKNDKL
jgi:hypothetical protein